MLLGEWQPCRKASQSKDRINLERVELEHDEKSHQHSVTVEKCVRKRENLKKNKLYSSSQGFPGFKPILGVINALIGIDSCGQTAKTNKCG